MKTYTGKEIKKHGVWYSVTIQADSLKEANEKVNKDNHSGEDLRGRFFEEKHFRGNLGGKRPGAGRPKKEPTKVVSIRVPVKYVDRMKAAINKEYNKLKNENESSL